jgi:hypothetical protein
MRTFTYRSAVRLVLLSALLLTATANAQIGDLLKQGQNPATTGSAGSLGGIGGALSGKSFTAGSTGNVAGLLEFCIKHNYLGGKDVSSVRDALMGKLSGGSAASGSDYKDGAQGLLKGSNGKQLDLSGGGLKAQLSSQVCDQVLAQAKSLL